MTTFYKTKRMKIGKKNRKNLQKIQVTKKKDCGQWRARCPGRVVGEYLVRENRQTPFFPQFVVGKKVEGFGILEKRQIPRQNDPNQLAENARFVAPSKYCKPSSIHPWMGHDCLICENSSSILGGQRRIHMSCIHMGHDSFMCAKDSVFAPPPRMSSAACE